jgi:murein tripeptide amidase MpaA
MKNKERIRRTVLCRTIAGNDCDMVIITNFSSKPEDIALRKAVILTSRVHPGESNASFIMHGILDYLVSDDEGARYLRNNFVFKIVPMLNPDGVIVGNYRCSLSGQDLNRQWITPMSKVHPEIYAVKLMIKKTLESRDIIMFCDIHGHSRQKNIFMYGCQNQKMDRLKEKIFPFLYSKRSQNFSMPNCNFNI